MTDPFLLALSESDLDEVPVTIEVFVSSSDYLGLPPLSEYQYQMARAGTQIYRHETLLEIYGNDTEAAQKRFAQTTSECIFCLGKGAGKDHLSTIICAYVVYLLLCLKDPQKYYGKPAGNSIDLLNVATNSDQAKNVFFKNLKAIIKNCPWFDGKYDPPTQNSISFDKSINLYSGHSEREAFEGLNLFLAVLDEISAFADTETESPEDTYNTYRDSVDSRFPDGVGKVLLLSFPRKRTGDFILDKYNEVVAEKEVIIKTRTLKLDPDLPDGVEGNEFDVSWEEDHILRYKYPRIFALKRPSWEVNPTKNIEMYTRNFHSNMANALAKFACMPTDGGEDAFFKNHDVLEEAFTEVNIVDQSGVFLESVVAPDPDKQYFVHVDLSKVHDRCAIAMAHVEDWQSIRVSPTWTETYPIVKVDAVRWWQPSKDSPMDYTDVVNFVMSLRRKGYNIKLCTLDRWSSHDTINILNSVGIKSHMFSVKNEHYDTLATLVYDRRVKLPNVSELLTEMKQLQYIKDKVDHPSSGYKDISDACAGAINNAIINTPKPRASEVEVLSYADIVKRRREEALREIEERSVGVIEAPKPDMPDELRDYMRSLRLL